ncbi:flagellar FLiS export co-chaperone [Campylobacter upsaliensis]|uniref:Uncharacterized protein n=1 Tax=Campylobacter upsaliensis TaxID=28080 RepID=A0A7U8B483_CAMUP|nr:flagellar FLiS export co-chaperone [Campylobacter upsaliensis]EAJ1621799.1 hypothetical protein [Campylobacter upsaliensis]MCR2088238.1 flagellar FLiS export co-chaperone [Campylobacter upsaliensis]MCR2097219.1 flagellar FLiS export co-chaperone [Campylobacter upsaliensis]
MKSELDILKQHLGEVDGVSEFKAKQLCSQISDANDFIGALQVLDLSLKKIQNNITQRLQKDTDEVQKRTLDAASSQLVNSCSFMGTALFDNIFNVYVGQKLFEFEISNPLLVLDRGGYEGVLAYIEDKREEIKANLSELSGAILMGSNLNTTSMFDTTQDFKKLFK